MQRPAKSIISRWIVGFIMISLVFFGLISNVTPAYADEPNPENTPEAPTSMPVQNINPDDAVIYYHSQTGRVRFIGVKPGETLGSQTRSTSSTPPEEIAMSFLGDYGSLFGLQNAAEELVEKKANTSTDGRVALRYQQVYHNIPVFAGELIVNLDNVKNVSSASGEIIPDLALNPEPSISAEQAQQTAIGLAIMNHKVDPSILAASDPELWVYSPMLIDQQGDDQLVWRVEVNALDLRPIRELVLVNAHDGTIALNYNQVETGKQYSTYTMNNSNNQLSLPGTLICTSDNPSCSGGDSDAKKAHRYTSDTYDFYYTRHGRDSIDGSGMLIKSSVHYGYNYVNAFWNGSQMVYGDGMAADDVVGHELTHGVTQYTSNLIYYGQSGAINESFSDVWGEFVDQTNGAGTDTQAVKWLIGEDISNLGAIRNMADPTQFGDPDRIGSSYFYTGASDNNGVHTNSGVNNKAAYLMTDGGTFNGYTVTGIGLNKVAKLYYEVQTNQLTSGANYNDLYTALNAACAVLQTAGTMTADDCLQVDKAALAVEMNGQPTPPEGAPVNDDFNAAKVIEAAEMPVKYTDNLNVSSATAASDDPSLIFYNGVWMPLYRTVWYQFTAPEDSTLKLDTIGSDYDTYLVVWQGSRGALTKVAFNDDINYTGSYFQSKLITQLKGGSTYMIEVAAYNNSADYNLTLNFSYSTNSDGSVVNEAYDDADKTFTYTGRWDTSCSGKICNTAQNYSLHISTKVGSHARLTFNGDQIAIYYMAVKNAGAMQVIVDGIPLARINQSYAKKTPISRAWRWSGLGNGEHTLLLKHVSGKKVNLDYIETRLATTTTSLGDDFEDDDAGKLAYFGNWQLDSGSAIDGVSGASVTKSLKKNDNARFTFSGSEYCVRLWKVKGSGKISVYLDGDRISNISLSSKKRGYTEYWFYNWNIPEGTHTVQIKNITNLPITLDQVVIGPTCSNYIAAPVQGAKNLGKWGMVKTK
jgi:Zn-dependent metalloprotease